ncbi:hypothetical protein [Clostridioides difficile]|uniref:hypothetical protein n=1 Tax=Clostridioides difficile TaxID=1496 RepID=UPI002FCFAF68
MFLQCLLSGELANLNNPPIGTFKENAYECYLSNGYRYFASFMAVTENILEAATMGVLTMSFKWGIS